MIDDTFCCQKYIINNKNNFSSITEILQQIYSGAISFYSFFFFWSDKYISFYSLAIHFLLIFSIYFFSMQAYKMQTPYAVEIHANTEDNKAAIDIVYTMIEHNEALFEVGTMKFSQTVTKLCPWT